MHVFNYAHSSLKSLSSFHLICPDFIMCGANSSSTVEDAAPSVRETAHTHCDAAPSSVTIAEINDIIHL